jgi:hypothetical protein
MTNLARLASAKAFAGGSTPTAMPQLAKAASPATPVANGGEGPARLYDLQQMVNTYRKVRWPAINPITLEQAVPTAPQCSP